MRRYLIFSLFVLAAGLRVFLFILQDTRHLDYNKADLGSNTLENNNTGVTKNESKTFSSNVLGGKTGDRVEEHRNVFQIPKELLTGFLKYLDNFKVESEKRVRSVLPSPHSELLLGMVLGVDNLSKNYKFSENLKNTGTMHVVVVSGFNISIIFKLVFQVLGSKYKRKNVVLAFLATLFYAVLCGFEPPVVRAWVMGSVSALGTFYGRKTDAFVVLIFSAVLMLIISPGLYNNLSFILSFSATLGLVLYERTFSGIFHKIFNLKSFLLDDLSSTCAAQVIVWPIISYSFGSMSLISPLVNMLILWTVSLTTVLGGLFIVFLYINSFLSVIISYPIYILTNVFISVVNIFGDITYAVVSFKINIYVLTFYYILLLFILLLTKSKQIHKKNLLRLKNENLYVI